MPTAIDCETAIRKYNKILDSNRRANKKYRDKNRDNLEYKTARAAISKRYYEKNKELIQAKRKIRHDKAIKEEQERIQQELAKEQFLKAFKPAPPEKPKRKKKAVAPSSNPISRYFTRSQPSGSKLRKVKLF